MREDIKKIVRDRYGRLAGGEEGCCDSMSPCCGSSVPGSIAKRIGYRDEELGTLPEGANLGLGCGNPVSFSLLRPGQTVVDLGSGAGIDCFLAAKRVGEKGRVIGIDMTPEMVEKARENASRGRYENVEFKLGEIERMPLPDECADVVMSNCVINLSTDKPAVFKEAYRVLKNGGSLVVSDIVLLSPLPDCISQSISAYLGCIAGASLKDDYLRCIRQAGFEKIELVHEFPYSTVLTESDPAIREMLFSLDLSREELRRAASSVLSITLRAQKPLAHRQ